MLHLYKSRHSAGHGLLHTKLARTDRLAAATYRRRGETDARPARLIGILWHARCFYMYGCRLHALPALFEAGISVREGIFRSLSPDDD